MKILKYTGIIIVVLALLYAGLCALSSNNFDMVEKVKIEAPSQVIFNILNDLKTTEQWNDWNLKDTAMVVTYTDKSVGVGAKTSWTSAMTGNGSQEIVTSVPNQNIKTALVFDGYDNTDHAIFDLLDDGKQTNLSWTFETSNDLPFLMRGAMALMGMKKSMRKSFKAGLKNIKTLAEQRSKESIYNGYKIIQTEAPEKNYVMTRQEVSFDKISQFFGSSQGALFSKLQKAGVEMDGSPCGLFFRYDESNGVTDMATAIPIAVPVSIAETSSYSLEAKKALQVEFYGDFSKTEPAHYAMDAYMKDHDLLQDAPIIEEYITDTSSEKDPQKWLTLITYYYSEKG